MPLEYTTTSAVVTDAAVKVLTYSESGIGKTVMCATAPDPIILSAESGLLSLSRANIVKMFGADRADICYDIPVIKIQTVGDLIDALALLQTRDCDRFKTVCLDSLTEIAEVVLRNAKPTVKDPRMAYGILLEQMTDVVRKYRDLPNKHVYMTAKSEYSKDEATGLSKYGPMMPGNKFGQALPYLFDEVFRLFVHKDQAGATSRMIQTQPDLQHTAKDRSGILDSVEYPHLGYLFNKMTGKQA